MAVGVPAKRRKLSELHLPRADAERTKMRKAAAVAALLGRWVRVCRDPMAWSSSGTHGGGVEPPRAASGTSPAVIRVVFPDGFVLEARFGRSETMQQLVDLLRRAISRPELPFHVWTAPPRERIVDMARDFRSAGFVPGAIVRFCWDSPGLAVGEGAPYLRDDVRSLEDVDVDFDDLEDVCEEFSLLHVMV